jgi:Tol biopolymer transport system component
MRPNGERRFLGRGLLWGGQPWSPDGLRLIIGPPDGHPDNGQVVTIANLATGETQRLELDYTAYGSNFDWSPDGNFLLYNRIIENNAVELRLYDFAQQTSGVLIEIPRSFTSEPMPIAGWSADSKQIAFIGKLNGQFDLYTLEVETSALRQLTFSPEAETLAAWSPVSNQLVVVTSPEPWMESLPFFAEKLQVMDDTGIELIHLGPYEYMSTAAWSPDGQRIVYSADNGLCILDIATQDSTCPLEDTVLGSGYSIAQDYPAAWSADGNWLAFDAIKIPGLLCYRLFLLDFRTNTIVDPDVPSCMRSYLYWSRAAP